jgi:hypothetical protein
MANAERIGRTRRVSTQVLIVVCMIAAVGSPALADRIQLRGGGQLRGKLLPVKDHPDQLSFIGETGKAPMILKKERILQVTPEKGPLDDYLVLRDKERTTPEAELELGTWCDDHGLADLARVHFEAALKLDASFGPAHEKLGHVFLGGRWLNSDELREAQGMVKFKGKWITQEEKERKDAVAALAAENAAWSRKVKALREAYLAGPMERSRDAERRLLAIREPAAVSSVYKQLGEDPLENLRSLAARVLGAIPGVEAGKALAHRLLDETDPEVRETTMTELIRHDDPDVVAMLVRALRSTNSEVINRAAWGLGRLNALAAVPRLVPALVTVEYQTVMTTDPVNSGAGSNFGLSSTSIGSATGVPFSNGFATGTNLPVLTGPAVAPGVVAYGVTSVPGGYAGLSNGASFSFGPDGGSPRGPTPKVVAIEHQNVEVLAALNKMTGRNFGFDVVTWKRWVTTSFRIDQGPTRRVPEP